MTDVNDSEYGTEREERRWEIAETHGIWNHFEVYYKSWVLADLVNRISEMSSTVPSRIVARQVVGPEAASAHLRTRLKRRQPAFSKIYRWCTLVTKAT